MPILDYENGSAEAVTATGPVGKPINMGRAVDLGAVGQDNVKFWTELRITAKAGTTPAGTFKFVGADAEDLTTGAVDIYAPGAFGDPVAIPKNVKSIIGSHTAKQYFGWICSAISGAGATFTCEWALRHGNISGNVRNAI